MKAKKELLKGTMEMGDDEEQHTLKNDKWTSIE